MKKIAFVLLLLSFLPCSNAETPSSISTKGDVSGRYEGKTVAIEVAPAEGAYFRTHIYTKNVQGCIGDVVGRGKLSQNRSYLTVEAVTDEKDTCVLEMGPLHESQIRVRENSSCQYFHGATCSFEGSVKKVDSRATGKSTSVQKARKVSRTPVRGDPDYVPAFDLTGAGTHRTGSDIYATDDPAWKAQQERNAQDKSKSGWFSGVTK